MKKIAIAILGALALCISGCFSVGKEYAKFIQEVPGAMITDISTVTTSPFWGFQASASGISTDPLTGTLNITNGKALFTIPLWGFSKSFSVSGLQLKASPAQLQGLPPAPIPGVVLTAIPPSASGVAPVKN